MNNNTIDIQRVPEILNTKQVAVLLGHSEQTIRRWAQSGVIPAIKRGPRVWEFRKSQILEGGK